MKEFKGTNNEWYAYTDLGKIRDANGTMLALFYYTNDNNKKELPYNTKVASKAPQMLEMLKMLLKHTEDIGIYKQIEHLINEATNI
jgi:hypothetical protein